MTRTRTRTRTRSVSLPLPCARTHARTTCTRTCIPPSTLEATTITITHLCLPYFDFCENMLCVRCLAFLFFLRLCVFFCGTRACNVVPCMRAHRHTHICVLSSIIDPIIHLYRARPVQRPGTSSRYVQSSPVVETEQLLSFLTNYPITTFPTINFHFLSYAVLYNV